MTVSLAKAVAADGITVNAVAPSTIRSSTLEDRFREVAKERGLGDVDTPWQDIERAILPMFAQVPAGRVGELEEIANAIAFLASPGEGCRQVSRPFTRTTADRNLRCVPSRFAFSRHQRWLTKSISSTRLILTR